MCVYIYIYIYYVCIFIYIYTYIHTYTHIHMYVQLGPPCCIPLLGDWQLTKLLSALGVAARRYIRHARTRMDALLGSSGMWCLSMWCLIILVMSS